MDRDEQLRRAYRGGLFEGTIIGAFGVLLLAWLGYWLWVICG